MLKNVLNQRLGLGRLFIVLLFAGGLVFAGTYDGFVAKTDTQKSCCGGNTDAIAPDGVLAQLVAKSCCGSTRTDVPRDGTDTPRRVDDPCECVHTDNCGSTSCDPDDCSVITACGEGDCKGNCNKNEDGRPCADNSHCDSSGDDPICGGDCSYPSS